MPQVDLETLVSACAGGGNDRKVACETLAAGEAPANDDFDDDESEPEIPPEIPPDFPPESFWLSKDAEFDWFDRNAFLERKESTKGIGPMSSNLNLNNPSSNSNSQRFSSSLKRPKGLIIGFPKQQNANFVDSKRRTCRYTANVRLFPARQSMKSTSVNEPSSPKVSCMGRVRSKRRKSKKHDKKGSLERSGSSTGKAKNKKRSLERTRSSGSSAVKSGITGEKKKTGLYKRLLSMFRSNRSKNKPVRLSSGFSNTEKNKPVEVVKEQLRKSRSVSSAPVCGEPVGLGAMKRFASGRKSESWIGGEVNGVH